jgi:hypothetical protein
MVQQNHFNKNVKTIDQLKAEYNHVLDIAIDECITDARKSGDADKLYEACIRLSNEYMKTEKYRESIKNEDNEYKALAMYLLIERTGMTQAEASKCTGLPERRYREQKASNKDEYPDMLRKIEKYEREEKLTWLVYSRIWNFYNTTDQLRKLGIADDTETEARFIDAAKAAGYECDQDAPNGLVDFWMSLTPEERSNHGCRV